MAIIFSFGTVGIISVDAVHDEKSSRGSSDPKIAIDEDDAFVVWVESNQPEFGDVYFTKIIEGKNVKEPINITQGSSLYPRPQIHVNENNVYLLWEDRIDRNGDDQIIFAKSNDGGETFSQPRSLPENNQSIYRPFSVHQVNDTVYIFGSNWDRASQQNRIIMMASQDFGETFSEPVMVFNHEQSDQEIQVKVYGDTIYILSDDRSDFDDKGSIYLRKILPDGTLTEIVNVNGQKTKVHYPQFAVSGENVYVSWSDRAADRWFPALAKSHDGGNSFEDFVILETDPKAIDTYGVDGNFIFATGDSVFVLWRSEYWDGENQTFKTYIASSDNKGDDFKSVPLPLNERLFQHGYVLSSQDNDNISQIAITAKNPPYNDAAVFFEQLGLQETKPVDILKDIKVQIGWMPDFASDKNNVHFVTSSTYDKECILYSYSEDGGKSFGKVVNLSPNSSDSECLGVKSTIANPLKQISTGTQIHNIQCKDDRDKGYLLVLRESNNEPLCVSSLSYGKMLDRNFVSEKSFEAIAKSAASDYLLTHPKISANIVEDSLDLEIHLTRHSIPPAFIIRGSFESSGPIYEDDENPFHHTLEITLVQNNKIHNAKIDDAFPLTEFDESEARHPSQKTIVSPTLKTILSPGERVNNKGLIPLVISEVSEGGFDQTTHWTFQSIGYHGDNRDKLWGFLPDNYRVSETVDQDGVDAIDRQRMPENFGIPMPLFIFPILCGDERIEGESGWHYTLPTRTDTSMVYFRSTDKGIYPDQDGVYHIRFVSMFKTETQLQPNLQVITNKTVLCPMENTRNDSTHAYYTNLEFTIDDSWTASYYSPESTLAGKDVDQHGTILVKIFGDKFDFSHSDFHLKDPRINFEQADPDLIHRNSDSAPLSVLFETLEMRLDSKCFVFPDSREFCTNEEHSLKFYVNDVQKDDISQYLVSEDDKVLISYGTETKQEITQQLEELDSIAKYNYRTLDKLMTLDVGTVRDATYNGDLGFKTVEKLFRIDMERQSQKHMLEAKITQKQHEYDGLIRQNEEPAILQSLLNEITQLENELDDLIKMENYTNEEIFQRTSEIESENIKMYKIGPEKYQEYVAIINELEEAISEQSLAPGHVKINSENKMLEIILPQDIKNVPDAIQEYELVIDDSVPQDIPWKIIFSDDN